MHQWQPELCGSRENSARRMWPSACGIGTRWVGVKLMERVPVWLSQCRQTSDHCLRWIIFGVRYPSEMKYSEHRGLELIFLETEYKIFNQSAYNTYTRKSYLLSPRILQSCRQVQCLEDLVTQIDVPLLASHNIIFFNQLIFDISQHHQFDGCTERLR